MSAFCNCSVISIECHTYEAFDEEDKLPMTIVFRFPRDRCWKIVSNGLAEGAWGTDLFDDVAHLRFPVSVRWVLRND